jgi:hypothetical protein
MKSFFEFSPFLTHRLNFLSREFLKKIVGIASLRWFQTDPAKSTQSVFTALMAVNDFQTVKSSQ